MRQLTNCANSGLFTSARGIEAGAVISDLRIHNAGQYGLNIDGSSATALASNISVRCLSGESIEIELTLGLAFPLRCNFPPRSCLFGSLIRRPEPFCLTVAFPPPVHASPTSAFSLCQITNLRVTEVSQQGLIDGSSQFQSVRYINLYNRGNFSIRGAYVADNPMSHGFYFQRAVVAVEDALVERVGDASGEYCYSWVYPPTNTFTRLGLFNSTCQFARAGVNMQPDYAFAGSAQVYNNTFRALSGANNALYYTADYFPGRAWPMLDYAFNTVADSLFSSDMVDVRIPCCKNTLHRIRENTFSNNSVTSGFNLIRVDKYEDTASIAVDILSNSFLNNTAANGIRLTSSGGTGPRRPDILFNLFVGSNLTGAVLRVELPDANLPINATRNYWGTTSEFEIIERMIYDIADDQTRESVLYFPYLVAADPAAVVDPDVARTSFIAPDGTVRGVVAGRGRLSLADAPLPNGTWLVTGNLIVLANATFEIEPGVTLWLAPDVSINVKGTLLSEGTPARPITFTCDPRTAQPAMQNVSCRNTFSTSNYPSYTDSRMTATACVAFCSEHGHPLAALQDTNCLCLNGLEGTERPSTECTTKCRGEK